MVTHKTSMGGFKMSWDGPEYPVWVTGAHGPRTQWQRDNGLANFDPAQIVRDWIVENIQGGFWWDEDGIRFQLERDAVLFKLRWY